MSGTEVKLCVSPFTLEALNNDIVLETIVSHLGNNNLLDLTKYRSVCHKWNDVIVRKINKSAPSLHIPLRYGPETPLLIDQSEAQCLAEQILKTILTTLTGTAPRLFFDTVVVDRDFYLAGVKEKWTDFLKLQGQSVRHLKFKIRSGKVPKSYENHVTNCEEIMSMEDLMATFSATPNLESLYISIRFSDYLTEPLRQPKPMDLGHVPVLHKLTNITIREPKGISYPSILLEQVLRLAPNLTSLCIKPSSVLYAYGSAMKSIENQIKESLISLNISNAHLPVFNDSRDMILPYLQLQLTTLELNNIHGVGMHNWIAKLLLAQSSSLIKLILGDRKNHDSYPLLKVEDYQLNLTDLCFARIPTVMEHLKFLEVNLSKFGFLRDDSYQIQFPVLESFTLSGARENGHEWTLDHIGDLLPLRSGQSLTLKEFSLLGPILELEQEGIILGVRVTFPLAECNFHSDSDNQYSRELQRYLHLLE